MSSTKTTYAILLFGARMDLPLNTVFMVEDYKGLKEYWKL